MHAIKTRGYIDKNTSSFSFERRNRTHQMRWNSQNKEAESLRTVCVCLCASVWIEVQRAISELVRKKTENTKKWIS